MQNMHWHSMTRLMLAYLQAMWGKPTHVTSLRVLTQRSAWQGGHGDIPWSQPNLVEKQRMPTSIGVLSHPDDWDQTQTWLWVNWTRMDQIGAHDESQRFQFQLLGPTVSEHRYRRDIHQESPLRYGPDARVFLGRIIRAPSDDEIATSERRSYFIKPTRVINTKLFSDDAETRMLEQGQSIAFVKALTESVLRYESKHPVRVSSCHAFPITV